MKSMGSEVLNEILSNYNDKSKIKEIVKQKPAKVDIPKL
jgi:hypothetical protein